MQGLSLNNFKTLSDKLLVLAEHGAFQGLVAAIHGIIEKRMTQKLHMCAIWWVRPVSSLHSINETYRKSVNSFVVGDGVPAEITFGKRSCHTSVFQTSAHIYVNGSLRGVWQSHTIAL